MRTLQDSFTTSWVIGDDTIKMGPKKMKERVREQYFQALEEQNKKAEEKVSSVKGIQVKQADKNTLGSAIASGFRQGESAYSQYQRGIQRVGQGARSVGLDVKTDPRALGSQISTTFGPTQKRSAGRAALNLAMKKSANRTGFTPSRTSRSTGAPPLPGAVGATSLSPIPALPSDAAFTKSGEQVEGTTEVNNKTTTVNTKNTTSQETKTTRKKESKNCPCCQRELAEGAEPITVESVKNVWSDLKDELAGNRENKNEERVSKFRSSKGKINNRREMLKEAKLKIEEEMEKKKKEILNKIKIEGKKELTIADLDTEISRLADESEAVDTEADKLESNLKKQRNKEKRERCIADSNAVKSAEIVEKEDILSTLRQTRNNEKTPSSTKKKIAKQIKKLEKEIEQMKSGKKK